MKKNKVGRKQIYKDKANGYSHRVEDIAALKKTVERLKKENTFLESIANDYEDWNMRIRTERDRYIVIIDKLVSMEKQ